MVLNFCRCVYVEKNKGADQLHIYRASDLRFCFGICEKQVFSGQGSFDASTLALCIYDSKKKFMTSLSHVLENPQKFNDRIDIAMTAHFSSVIYGNEETYEPCHEKTCLRDFLPGPIQNGLYSNIRWLEA